MRRLRYLIVMMCAAAGLLQSCSGGSEREERDDSDLLYKASLALIAEYSDSISLATDSAQAADIFLEFSSRLDSLNFAVEANTDLLLTEGENDTLFRRLSALRRLYEQKLVPPMPSDTVQQNDTI